MKERIAIVNGMRTPFAKANTVLKNVPAEELGAFVFKELIEKIEIDASMVDELILGCVGQPSNAANIARVVALKAGLDKLTPAFTVHRNCASGMESITTAASKILSGDAEVILAGGAESMSNYPLMFGKRMTDFFEQLSKVKTTGQKLSVLSSFRPSMLKPRIAVVEGLTDPVCGMIMGNTAEVLAKEFHIDRDSQDRFAMESHLKAEEAQKSGRLGEEIISMPVFPNFKSILSEDNGIRYGQSMEALAKLRPYFDRINGSVTVGNACPLTDGAAAVLVMKESKARELGLQPMGYLREFAYAGLDPHRMGLGPVYSSAKVFKKSGLSTQDMDIVEINEAFAVQVMANMKAWDSKEFCQKELGLTQALGEIDPQTLNPNGGAIALGHPVGTTGTRMIITLLKELRRQGKQRGLATLCIGGGQGGAVILEVE
jgi:acetyl-CoA acyltransferase